MAKRPIPLPEDYPFRSFLGVLSYRAQATPDDICLQQPNKDLSQLFTFTYADLMRAVSALAGWLLSQIPGETCCAHPIAYIGPSDFRYLIVPLALAKVGGLAQNLSLRNSQEGISNLIRISGAQICLYGSDDVLGLLPSQVPQSRLRIPALRDLVVKGSPIEVLREVKYETAPILMTQTSGSTGLSKPVKIHMDAASSVVPRMYLPDIDGLAPLERVYMSARNIFVDMQVFHCAGFLETFKWALYLGCPVTIRPVMRTDVMDGALTLDLLRLGYVDACFCAPSALFSLGQILERDQSGSAAESLRKAKYIASSGAKLPEKACAKIACLTDIIPKYVSTETFTTVTLYRPSDIGEWGWVHIPPEYSAIRWEPVSDDLNEMVIINDPKLAYLQGVFRNFPDLSSFRTRDLFEAHPTQKNHFRCVGRSDDIINFLDACSIHPHRIELAVCECDLVKSAMAIGDGRPFLIVLVEPKVYFDPNSTEWDMLREKIWEQLTSVNMRIFRSARVPHERCIMFTSPKKGLPKTTDHKRTLMRPQTLGLYAREIDEMYEQLTSQEA